jgi:hypothetical protein
VPNVLLNVAEMVLIGAESVLNKGHSACWHSALSLLGIHQYKLVHRATSGTKNMFAATFGSAVTAYVGLLITVDLEALCVGVHCTFTGTRTQVRFKDAWCRGTVQEAIQTSRSEQRTICVSTTVKADAEGSTGLG